MRWLFSFGFIISLALIGAYTFVENYPQQLYQDWMSGQRFNRYFDISNYGPLLLAPVEIESISPYQEDYVQLWKEFPLRSILIPLPTRHPLFQTIPVIQMISKDKAVPPQIGIALLDPSSRELSRVYGLPTKLYPDHSQGQELFKLPYVRKRILAKGQDELWRDVFSLKFQVKDKSIDEMLYDLYILHVRSKLLPKETIRYGLIKEGKQALIELNSNDKDYMVELVLTLAGGTIYSYVLRTDKQNSESQRLRAKFLDSIIFSQVDEAMGRFLYKEFKHLNFARQVDQEGMLYLYSAWSQNPENQKFLKEMISFLERGRNNKKQLKALYEFSLRRYGKTFTERNIEDDDDPEMSLQRKIEVEEKNRFKEAESKKVVNPQPIKLSPEEKMNLHLKKAKETKKREKSEMTVY
jgi:hypothetical protein